MELPSLPKNPRARGLKSLMVCVANFQRCREAAREALKRHDLESARWWGQQARYDWRSVTHAFEHA